MLINAHISWRRRRSSTEIASNAIPDHPDRTDVGNSAVERDALWQVVNDLPPKQRAGKHSRPLHEVTAGGGA
jgi:DNA-directed RNA polymerase specialized sigma24 family protein